MRFKIRSINFILNFIVCVQLNESKKSSLAFLPLNCNILSICSIDMDVLLLYYALLLISSFPYVQIDCTEAVQKLAFSIKAQWKKKNQNRPKMVNE